MVHAGLLYQLLVTSDNSIKSIGPYIKSFDYSYYTHASWTQGQRTDTYTLSIVPNGAKSITLAVDCNITGDPTYAVNATATISSVENGSWSEFTVTPTNNKSDVTVTISFEGGTVTYSGASFVRSVYIESFTN